MITPWGKSDHEEILAPHITFYTTPSHGGIRIGDTVFCLMPKYFQEACRNQWFEEDCDWAMVAISFPGAFKQDDIEHAKECLKQWHPKLWAQHLESLQ